jgi:hypothetical protein
MRVLRGPLSFLPRSLFLSLVLGGAIASVGEAQIRPPAVKAPTAPAGANTNPTVVVDPKVPLAASVEAPLQVPAGEPFKVVVRLQAAAGADAYPSGGCVVTIQGREFLSQGFGSLLVEDGKRTRTEAVDVVAPIVGPADIEITPYTQQGSGRAVGVKVVRKCTVVSETPMRRGGHDGVRNGARLILGEPVSLKPACSFDGRALFALTGSAPTTFGVSRYDTATGAETAYLPLANFRRMQGASLAITYERRANRVFVAVTRKPDNNPPEILLAELDADTLAVRRVIRSGPLRWSTGANSFVDDQGSIEAVLSGREGVDVAVLKSSASPTNAATKGAVAWFSLQQNRCVSYDLFDSMAVASGAPGLAGAWIRGDRAVVSAPLAAGGSALLHMLTMGQDVRVVEAAGSAVRHFAAVALTNGGVAPRIEAVAGVSDGRLYAVTNIGILAWSLGVQPPQQIGIVGALPAGANGRAFDTQWCVAAVNGGRVVVGGRDGVCSWQIANGTSTAVDASMLGDAGFLTTITAILPTTANQVVVKLDKRPASQPNGPSAPTEFAFVLLK